METIDINRHPCFNPDMKGRFGRIHLPVAPQCNIKCNYCNRKYDCVNESRPGVTSSVLSPEQALLYLEKVMAAEPGIAVVGIAGPGDPFANPEATMETLRLVRQKYPAMLLCLASNGLAIAPFIEELAELGVSHVTITVNAVDPDIGRNIYGWVSDGNMILRGRQAAEFLLMRQLAAIRKLKEKGITVKINSILIPGVNEGQITDIAAKMKDLDADLFNCMALFPNPGTAFEQVAQPSREVLTAIQEKAEFYLPQMRHCTRCRADAVGLLDNDRTEEFRGCLSDCSRVDTSSGKCERCFVAVGTMEGILINQHLGAADSFQIWKRNADSYELLEVRKAPAPGDGMRRWMRLSKLLADCKAILISGVGESPREILETSGLQVLEMQGFIEEGLKAVFEGKKLNGAKGRRTPFASKGCTGTGGGCM